LEERRMPIMAPREHLRGGRFPTSKVKQLRISEWVFASSPLGTKLWDPVSFVSLVMSIFDRSLGQKVLPSDHADFANPEKVLKLPFLFPMEVT
jgi:hypothetical protein